LQLPTPESLAKAAKKRLSDVGEQLESLFHPAAAREM